MKLTCSPEKIHVYVQKIKSTYVYKSGEVALYQLLRKHHHFAIITNFTKCPKLAIPHFINYMYQTFLRIIVFEENADPYQHYISPKKSTYTIVTNKIMISSNQFMSQ